ncbi:unnamed protein product [Schistocephalus solidus]|uniref:Zinc finger A20 and AN1 domain-containing stress-associated protein 6 n=1 Tax=Schistocephalus solidus TaxID=70667 RepID=A0A183SQQ5_SCHSO|nr:unnamed protein product [Schistocephalus solidus]
MLENYENDQAQAVPRLCRKGCGFYGSPNFDGFCSKCHRDIQATAEQVQSAVRLSASSGKGLVEDKPETSNVNLFLSVELSPAASESAPKKRLRCLMCNKRVGLTGFSCRCGGLFCTLHRYSDAHDCSFNYRESGQADIRKANPQVVCSKITKI